MNVCIMNGFFSLQTDRRIHAVGQHCCLPSNIQIFPWPVTTTTPSGTAIKQAWWAGQYRCRMYATSWVNRRNTEFWAVWSIWWCVLLPVLCNYINFPLIHYLQVLSIDAVHVLILWEITFYQSVMCNQMPHALWAQNLTWWCWWEELPQEAFPGQLPNPWLCRH